MNTSIGMNDVFHEEEKLDATSSKIKLRKKSRSKEKPESKHLHLILKSDSAERLEILKDFVEPQTQTEVVKTALQLFEEMVKEYENGSEFFIKRSENKQPVEYNILG